MFGNEYTVGGGWKKIVRWKLLDSHPSPNATGVNRPTKVRAEGHVVCLDEKTSAHRYFVGNLKEKDQLEDLGVNRRMKIKWISK
jgi:hypothetical protein